MYTENTESPEIFHLWCAMSALSSCAQRKIYLDLGHVMVSANLFTVLVAEPGKCKKGTAINISRGLTKDIPEVRVMSDSLTKEAIYKTMQQESQTTATSPADMTAGLLPLTHCSITIFAEEATVLIKEREFVDSLNALYNTLDDLAFRHTTKHSGQDVVMNPFLNLLGGTTPQKLSETLREDILEGGFSSRAFLVFSDNPRPRVPASKLPLSTRQIAARERLIKRLQKVATLFGDFKFPQTVLDYHDDWYLKDGEKKPSLRMSGFHERKFTHSLKLAMLHSLSINDSLSLDLNNIDFAIKALELIEPGQEYCLRGVGRNVLNIHAEQILEKIRKVKSVKLAQLIVDSYWNVNERELTEILSTLAKMGHVKTIVKEGAIYVEST